MMISTRLAVSLLLLLAGSAAAQQKHRDPLTDLEIDQLRDAAQLPVARLKLYVDYARVRLDKLQQVRADTKATDTKAADTKAEDRGQQTRDALQEFLDIYDELNTNVDTFADRKEDLRKALKPVIEADTEFGSKLRAFRASLASTPQEAESYAFLLGSALDTVDAAAKDHRDLLAEQEEDFKHKKKQGHGEDSKPPE
jgi:ABC-type transporter Mla subunit MlaD